MNASLYYIYSLIRIYKQHDKNNNLPIRSNKTRLDNLREDPVILLGGKKNRLIEQLISEAIAHFSMCGWEKNGQKITGDILWDLSGENESRNLYENFIQDSRRR